MFRSPLKILQMSTKAGSAEASQTRLQLCPRHRRTQKLVQKVRATLREKSLLKPELLLGSVIREHTQLRSLSLGLSWPSGEER